MSLLSVLFSFLCVLVVVSVADSVLVQFPRDGLQVEGLAFVFLVSPVSFRRLLFLQVLCHAGEETSFTDCFSWFPPFFSFKTVCECPENLCACCGTCALSELRWGVPFVVSSCSANFFLLSHKCTFRPFYLLLLCACK